MRTGGGLPSPDEPPVFGRVLGVARGDQRRGVRQRAHALGSRQGPSAVVAGGESPDRTAAVDEVEFRGSRNCGSASGNLQSSEAS